MKFGGHAGRRQPRGVPDDLSPEDVQVAGIEVGGREPAQIRLPRRRRVGRHVRAARTITEQGAPPGEVVVVGPHHALDGDLRVDNRGAVVEHRIDQQLQRQRRPSAVTGHQGDRGRQRPAGTVTDHRQSSRIDAELRRLRGQPLQRRVAVLGRGGMGMFGGGPVVHHQHRHPAVRHVGPHDRVVSAAGVSEVENHAAAVQIQRRTTG